MTANCRHAFMPAFLAFATMCSTGAVAAGNDHEPRFWIGARLLLPDGRRLDVGGLQDAGGYKFAVQRTNADGSPDPSFGNRGLMIAPIWGWYEAIGALRVQRDGKIVAGGNAADPRRYANDASCHPAFCGYYPAVIRLNADGSLDTSFNDTGSIVFKIGDANSGPGDVQQFGTLAGLSLDQDGKIVVYDAATSVDADPPATARINADGTLDTTFAGTKQVPREVRLPAVIEFHNTADFPESPGGHFFYASDPAEAAFVDNGAAGSFLRTGRRFEGGGTKQLCRFYGSVNPGPNSHFYTISDAECESLRRLQRIPAPNDVQQWNYEGLTFAGTPPAVEDGIAACPPGTVPVWRAYNNAYPRVWGKNPWDSAHRFSVDEADILTMVEQFGWRNEGIGFCAPRFGPD